MTTTKTKLPPRRIKPGGRHHKPAGKAPDRPAKTVATLGSPPKASGPSPSVNPVVDLIDKKGTEQPAQAPAAPVSDLNLSAGAVADRRAADKLREAKPAAKSKPAAAPKQTGAQPAEPSKQESDFGPVELRQILGALNSGFRERRSLWAATDTEIDLLADAFAKMLNKYLPEGTEYGPEGALIIAVATYALPRVITSLQQRRAVSREPAHSTPAVVKIDVPPAPLPSTVTSSDPRLTDPNIVGK